MTVTIHPEGASVAAPTETSTQEVVRKANTLTFVTDENGRSIGFRRLRALEAMDLNEIASGNSLNAGWMLYASMAFSVMEIAGEKVPRPRTKNELRAVVERLGNEGLDAIQAKLLPSEDTEAGAETEQAKNSPGTPI